MSAWKVGLAITLVQLSFTLVVSLFTGAPRGYRALFHWDSSWYERIVLEGYHSPGVLTAEDPGTAGFFPGYPMAARSVVLLTGLPPVEALLVTAQLCCWGFWTYFVLLCRRWQLSPRWTFALVLLLLLQPGSFFLVAAYSESTFLMGLMGFLYWSSRPGGKAPALAATHGFVMTATRLVGLPLVAFPLLYVLAQVSWRSHGALAEAVRRGAVPLLVGGLASLGSLSFFAYCQVWLGHWDQYMRTQQVGWGVQTDYGFLISGRFLWDCRLGPREHLLSPCFVGRASIVVVVAVFALALIAEAWPVSRAHSGWRARLPLYFCAFCLFVVPASTNCRNVSMMRLSIPVAAVLLCAVGHLLARRGRPRRSFWGRLAVSLSVGCLAGLHVYMLARYLRGWWVA
jgi:hypothetical protein